MLTLVLLALIGGSTENQARHPSSVHVETRAALVERFQISAAFSIDGDRLGSNFALSADEKYLYYTKGRASETTFDLMGVSLEDGATSSPMPLCGHNGGLPGDETCDETDFKLVAIPGDSSKLLIGAGDFGKYSYRLFVVDLQTGAARPILSGFSPRREVFRTLGYTDQLSFGNMLRISPSGRYLVADLYMYNATHSYSDQHFAVFSLETGRRELLYSLPFHVVPCEAQDPKTGAAVAVGQQEETPGFWDVWWEPSDVFIVRQRGGSGDRIVKVEAFQRDASGEWRVVVPPSQEPRRPWSAVAQQGVAGSILIGADANRSGGYLVEDSALFSAGPGATWLVEAQNKVVVLKKSSSGAPARLEVVVLKRKGSPASR